MLVIGQAESLATDVPPVIEEAAKQRVESYARRAESEGRLLGPLEDLPRPGWFCSPRIATDLAPGSPVLREEIFGPLLSVERVTGVEQACDIVDELPFGLTGGLFSRNPETVAAVVARTPVGNLYVNRAITGAKVGRQPFGGNRLSGTGIKAGGPHYLLQFVDGQVVTENTVRHGLAI
jgi:RHH-type proline utilization regulon transcriptional repressor/proline dehydrogenase/delta 1-pyrroline-5-carboxylate dehydrogenase